MKKIKLKLTILKLRQKENLNNQILNRYYQHQLKDQPGNKKHNLF